MEIFLIQPKIEGKFKTPPLGLQLIATVLKENGYKYIYDIDSNKGDDPYSLNYSGKMILVGITITFMTIPEAFKLAKFIKSQNSSAIIIFGGPQPTLMPEESIKDENVDIVVIGEGLHTANEIVNKIKNGEKLHEVKGIYFKNGNGEVIKTQPRQFIKDLDSIPFVDRTFFNEGKYREYQNNFFEKIFIPTIWHLMASQSCPFSCKMCQPALNRIAGPWRQRSVSNVISEIKLLKKKYNAKSFSFNDNDMGVDRKWMKEFCLEAIKIDGISMSCLGRASLLDYEMLKLMKKAGFNEIYFGAESGSDRVLKEVMGKKMTVQNIIDFANNCYKLRITAYAFWMLANPGERVEEMQETARLASELPVFYSHFQIALPNPGTQYYKDALEGNYLNMKSWDDVRRRNHPSIIKDGVSIDDIAGVDEYLKNVMVKKSWNYRYNGHILSFVNTRLFAKRHPIKVFGNEINLFCRDFETYHIRNIYLGLKSLVGLE